MLGVVVLVLVCGLLCLGFSKNEIFKGLVECGGISYIIDVDDRVNCVVNFLFVYGFGVDFQCVGQVGVDEVCFGDVLGLLIWENVDDGLLVLMGFSLIQLQELQVDSQGYIFVFYVGCVMVVGNSFDELCCIIIQKLEIQIFDLQVMVICVVGDGVMVLVMGKVNV